MNAAADQIAAPERSLADLRPGEQAYVSGLQVNGLLYRRLLDLGFVRGVPVKAEMASPAGDPIVFRVRGSQVALRRRDARLVRISDAAPAGCGSPGTESHRAGCCRSCPVAQEPPARPDADGAQYLVALAGNPNTGKSSLFNLLTGLRQHVGNWAGKTVMRAEGSFTTGGRWFKLVDLPGTYSLLSTSVEEEIARDFILFGSPDCTVVVTDATCLERNLNLVLQICQITQRVVVCVNLLDEAERKGISIDLKALSERLGVPVVGTSARTGAGLEPLRKTVLAVASGGLNPSPVQLRYDSRLESAVSELLPLVQAALPNVPNPRWIALRLIDGGDKRLLEEIREGLLRDMPGRIGAQSLPNHMPASGRKSRC